VIAAAIPDAMLLPTDECVAQEVPEPEYDGLRKLEAALHREWQQLSQQDIRHPTGGMRRRVEVVIQARGGYTRY
jgi:hypothetical protein